MNDPVQGLSREVDRLARRAAGDAAAAEDVSVIVRRLADARDILARMDATGPDTLDANGETRADSRVLRHDLVNALGAIDNYAELIGDDCAGLREETGAVRGAVRDVIARVRRGAPQPMG
ncbi:hypothetical protein [Roseospira navarrensis]|uniref:Histidine kinase n=1 Tax=Roseospira navarrensis TaxID=140058 RepID=A0A7X2D3B8_9PROT|nr:hypothetical protein [Roseospira navarrensis]MQX37209.1 hypothetical protein [Roseospira navarrensis]